MLARLPDRGGQLASAMDFAHLQADTIPKTPTWDYLSKEQEGFADWRRKVLGGAAVAPGGVCNPESFTCQRPCHSASARDRFWTVLDLCCTPSMGPGGLFEDNALFSYCNSRECDPEGTGSSQFLPGTGTSAKEARLGSRGRKSLCKFVSGLWPGRLHPVISLE